MIDRRPWSEFQSSGLLWWVNRALHLFGWAIVFECLEGQEPWVVYPAKVSFKGFPADAEEEGFDRMETQLRETFGGKG